MTIKATPQGKNPCDGVTKLTILVDPSMHGDHARKDIPKLSMDTVEEIIMDFLYRNVEEGMVFLRNFFMSIL